MNVQTISMDPRVAAIHFKDYRKKVRAHREARLAAAAAKIAEGGKVFRTARAERSAIEREDEVLMESYRALVKGARLINVANVIAKAGLDKEKRLPLLAIARADWTHAVLGLRSADQWCVVFADRTYPSFSHRHAKWEHGAVAFPSLQFPAELTNSEWRKGQGLPLITQGQNIRALVPAIPAHLRPAGDLSEFHILWEAKWEAAAPVDPLLLRHVAGNMYSVLAQWDLTPLEQAVLEGRIG